MIFLNIILILSIWCLGIKVVTAKGMILQGLGEWGNGKVEDGHKIWEPLLVCPWCLPSFHSLIGYSFAIGLGVIDKFEWRLVIMLPLVIMGASVVTGLTWTIYETVSQIHLYFKNLNEQE